MNYIKKQIKKYGLRRFFSIIDSRYGIGKLEQILNTNWLNPLATLWINIRSLPLRQAVKMPIFVYGRPRLYCTSGIIKIDGEVKTGMVKFNYTKPGAPSISTLQSEFNNKGQIIFKGKCEISTGTKILVSEQGVLCIENGVVIMDMINVTCYKYIEIGACTRISHRCQIMDSNFHFIVNLNKKVIPITTKEIRIGSHVWICNSTTIAAGSIIPNNIIVASNSLVNKDFSNVEEGSLIGGIPAKFVSSGLYRVYNKDLLKDLFTFYLNNPNDTYKFVELDVNRIR